MTDGCVLMWKHEEGEGRQAVGPAWIDAPDGSTRRVRGGDWITKAEARRIARAEGLGLFLDEGRLSELPTPAHQDVVRINGLSAKLRELGYAEEDVRVQPSGRGRLWVSGKQIVELGFVARHLPEEPIRADGYVFAFQTAVVGLSIDAAAAIVATLPPRH